MFFYTIHPPFSLAFLSCTPWNMVLVLFSSIFSLASLSLLSLICIKIHAPSVFRDIHSIYSHISLTHISLRSCSRRSSTNDVVLSLLRSFYEDITITVSVYLMNLINTELSPHPNELINLLKITTPPQAHYSRTGELLCLYKRQICNSRFWLSDDAAWWHQWLSCSHNGFLLKKSEALSIVQKP